MSPQVPNGADPSRPAGPDETIVLRDTFIAQGRTVPFENGWTWIAAAWSIFRRAVGLWIGIAIALLVIFIVMPHLGWIGAAASVVVAPALTAGLMVVSRTLDQGGDAQFGQLFAGFKNRFGSLVGVGVLSLIATTAIALLVGLISGVSIFAVLNATTLEAIMAAGAGLLLAMLLLFALSLPLAMALWFAPALAMFHDIGALAAMKASFIGCLRNMMPFLLYGIVVLIGAIVASIPLLLGWLVLTPVIAASIYTSYRDIYFSA